MMYPFYVTHSVFTNPGDYFAWYHDFSYDIPSLIIAVNQLFLHYADQLKFAKTIPKIQFTELDLRTIQKILDCLLQKSNQKLTVNRQSQQKVLGACRDSALLLCSVLRSRGIPARLRAGFNTYYNPNFYLDGFCLQYYDAQQNRWRMVDPRTTEHTIQTYHLNIDFDLSDLSEIHFIPAAKAWQLCRLNQVNPNVFGYRHFSGFNYIKNKVIQDFLLLNKYELLIWDLCGMMLEKNADTYTFIDYLAEFISSHENDSNEIQDFYRRHTLLQVPEKILVANPFLPERWEMLSC